MYRSTVDEINDRESRKNKLLKARQKGMSYDDIGRLFGISRQRVHQIIGKQNKNLFRPITTTRCVYDGIRNWMNDNMVSMAELTRRIYGQINGTSYNLLRLRLMGEKAIPKTIIDKILCITNLTYEEAFKRSDTDVLS